MVSINTNNQFANIMSVLPMNADLDKKFCDAKFVD